MCNVSVLVNGDVLAAYLSSYGNVEEVLPVRATDGTSHGGYILNIWLDREGFQAIPHIIAYEDQQMMVVVEGRRPFCWSCKQVGHLARSCTQKEATTQLPPPTTITPKENPVILWNLGTSQTIRKKDGHRSPERRNHKQKQKQQQQPKNLYQHQYHQKIQQQKQQQQPKQ